MDFNDKHTNMKKQYTSAIPFKLADKLNRLGLPKIQVPPPQIDMGNGIVQVSAVDTYRIPSYAYVFDWFAEKEIYILINAFPVDSAKEGRFTAYEAKVVDARNFYEGQINYKVEPYEYAPDYRDICEALNDAIEKAIEILEKDENTI